METWDAIRARRNVREFTSDPIPAGDLDRILEAGRRAPSSKNGQPWDFIVVTDRDNLERLSGVWQGARHVAAAQAAIAFIIPPFENDRQRTMGWFDLGHAVMAMMVMAADLGLGTGHAAVADQALAREVLGFPEDRECAMILSVGYPADRPIEPLNKPNRRPFDEVVHRERW
ncbi:MAG: nitroreductase family protein [Actinomycetes bacterium]|jgi:nitroreductase|nr:MAG: nitroreductase [Actinomycetota bacterium]